MSPNSSPVIPILFPFWARADHVLRRPLVPLTIVPNGPIFGYMTEQNGQVVPIPPAPVADWGMYDQAALQYLSTRPGQWKQEELELDSGAKRLVLACEDDPFACARIIDCLFMQQAHEILQSNRLFVCIPVQGVLFATRADMAEEDLQSFAELIYKAYSDTQFHPVSPILFLMEDGEIIQAMAGTEQAGTPVQRPLPLQVNKRQTQDGSYAVDISVKKTPPISSRITELVRVVEKTIHAEENNLSFGGQVTLQVNTGSGHRSADDEVEREIVLLQSKIDRLLAKNHFSTMHGYPITVSVTHFRPEDTEASLDRRSTGALTGSLLQSVDPAERAKSAEILGQRADPDAIRPLVAALEDEDALVRENSINALLRIGEPAVGYLEYFAETASTLGRVSAITALRKMEPGRFVSLFLRAAEHPDAEIREQAALGLVDVKDEAMLPTMGKFLRADSSGIRKLAVRWFSGFNTDWALDGLIDALADVDEEVRSDARKAIITRGKSVTETLRARKKTLDRNRQPVLYGEVTDVLEEVGGGGGLFGLFKKFF
jgi:hypothetical protein